MILSFRKITCLPCLEEWYYISLPYYLLSKLWKNWNKVTNTLLFQKRRILNDQHLKLEDDKKEYQNLDDVDEVDEEFRKRNRQDETKEHSKKDLTDFY